MLVRYDRIYIRFRGRKLGPITQDKAEDLIRRHQITKQHELSADSVSWLPADELFPELFAEESGEATSSKATAQPVAAVPVEVQWHAVLNGNKQGPIPETTLRAWIASGTVLPSTPIWCEGLQQFIEAEKIRPEWFFKPTTTNPTANPESSEELSAELSQVCQLLLAGRKWALLLAVVGITFFVLSLFGSTWLLLGVISRSERSPLILSSILQHLSSMLIALAFIVGFIFLLRYAQSLTPLRYLPTPGGIGIALQRLMYVWMFAGILSIVLSCLGLFWMLFVAISAVY